MHAGSEKNPLTRVGRLGAIDALRTVRRVQAGLGRRLSLMEKSIYWLPIIQKLRRANMGSKPHCLCDQSLE